LNSDSRTLSSQTFWYPDHWNYSELKKGVNNVWSEKREPPWVVKIFEIMKNNRVFDRLHHEGFDWRWEWLKFSNAFSQLSSKIIRTRVDLQKSPLNTTSLVSGSRRCLSVFADTTKNDYLSSYYFKKLWMISFLSLTKRELSWYKNISDFKKRRKGISLLITDHLW